jgi:hypothetical protein
MRYFTGINAGLSGDITFDMDIRPPAEAETIYAFRHAA